MIRASEYVPEVVLEGIRCEWTGRARWIDRAWGPGRVTAYAVLDYRVPPAGHEFANQTVTYYLMAPGKNPVEHPSLNYTDQARPYRYQTSTGLRSPGVSMVPAGGFLDVSHELPRPPLCSEVKDYECDIWLRIEKPLAATGFIASAWKVLEVRP